MDPPPAFVPWLQLKFAQLTLGSEKLALFWGPGGRGGGRRGRGGSGYGSGLFGVAALSFYGFAS